MQYILWRKKVNLDEEMDNNKSSNVERHSKKNDEEINHLGNIEKIEHAGCTRLHCTNLCSFDRNMYENVWLLIMRKD